MLEQPGHHMILDVRNLGVEEDVLQRVVLQGGLRFHLQMAANLVARFVVDEFVGRVPDVPSGTGDDTRVKVVVGDAGGWGA